MKGKINGKSNKNIQLFIDRDRHRERERERERLTKYWAAMPQLKI